MNEQGRGFMRSYRIVKLFIFGIRDQVRLVIKPLHKPSSSGRIHGSDAWPLTSWHACTHARKPHPWLSRWVHLKLLVLSTVVMKKNAGIDIFSSFLGVNGVSNSGWKSDFAASTRPFKRKLHYRTKKTGSWAFGRYVHGEQPLLSCHSGFILLSSARVIGVWSKRQKSSNCET